MLDETAITTSVRGFTINDSAFEYKTEVTPLNENPSEKIREYFDASIG